MINQKGQSLVELASFGTVLLLCLGMLIQYGMQANYQQNLQMQAFRKAMKAAYYKSGPGAAVSLSMTHDKAIPDARDPWGFPEHRPMGASASVTWDSNAQAIFIDDYTDPVQTSDLPRSIIEINNTMHLGSGDLTDAGINNIGQAQGAFTTAAFAEGGCNGSIMIALENINRESEYDEYRQVSVACSEIKVMNRGIDDEDPGKEYPYVRIDMLKRKITSADIDNDGKMETIIAVRGTQACDAQGYCGGISSFKYVDYQQGDIDTDYTLIYPWEGNKDENADGILVNDQQGLTTDYTIVKADNNSLVKTDNSSEFSTTTTLGAEQRVIHQIRLNDGSIQEHTTTFSPAFGPGRVSQPEEVDSENWRQSK